VADNSLMIRIDANTKAFKDKMQRLKDETANLEKTLSTVAKTSAVAFAGFSAAIGGTVAAYRKQEQAQLRTQSVLKATGFAAGITAKEVFGLAAEFQKVTTFGDEATIAGQNLLLTFKNIGKDVFPEVTEIMLDMSTAMDQDLKSSAIQLGKALNDPTVGMTALTRVGVTFSEEQKEMVKQLQASGDIMGAQKIILKELQSEFGGAAKAAAQGTGAFLQLKNEVGDFLEGIGSRFAPILSAAANILKKFFQFLKQSEILQTTVAIFLGLGAALTGVVTVGTTTALMFIKLRAAILASEVATRLLNTSMSLLGKGTILGIVLAGLVALVEYTVGWKEAIIQMEAVFAAFATRAGTFFKGLMQILTGDWKNGLQDIKQAFVDFDEEYAEASQFVRDREKQAEIQNVIETENEKLAARKAAALAEKKRRQQEEAAKQKAYNESRAVMFGIRTKWSKQEVQDAQMVFSQISTLQQSESKAAFIVGKAAAMANAIINTSRGVTLALGTFPPPFNFALAAAVGAAGAMQISKIAGTSIGLNKGGFVPGVGESDTVPAMLTPGELVVPKQEAKTFADEMASRQSSDATGTSDVNINFKPDEFMDWLEIELVQRGNLNLSLQGA